MKLLPLGGKEGGRVGLQVQHVSGACNFFPGVIVYRCNCINKAVRIVVILRFENYHFLIN